jgi:hypothetical protein
MATTKSAADLDVAVWLASNPKEAEPGAYPKLFYNVNLPPMLVRDAATEASIGSAWRPIDLLEPEEPGGPIPDVPPVMLVPANADVPVAGGSGSFDVTITGPGTSGTWTAEKDAVADWLTLDSPTTPQSTDGQVQYTVAANATGVARSANIYVNGQTFAITQAGV